MYSLTAGVTGAMSLVAKEWNQAIDPSIAHTGCCDLRSANVLAHYDLLLPQHYQLLAAAATTTGSANAGG